MGKDLMYSNHVIMVNPAGIDERIPAVEQKFKFDIGQKVWYDSYSRHGYGVIKKR